MQRDFDPALLSCEDLLRIFFAIHDPTTKDRQGADAGLQYRSAVFTRSPDHAAAAQRAIAEVRPLWRAPVVTEHQGYYARNPWAGCRQMVVAPKVTKFRKQLVDRLQAPASATA